jgi:PAS domain S-box-containing protein
MNKPLRFSSCAQAEPKAGKAAAGHEAAATVPKSPGGGADPGGPRARRGVETEIVAIVLIVAAAYMIAGRADLFETVHRFSRSHEAWELDEILPAAMVLALALLVFVFRRMRELHCELEWRVEAENRLREAEEKYRTVYENAPVGICQTTPEGEVLSCNSAFARMVGYSSPQEIISKVNVASDLYADPASREPIVDRSRRVDELQHEVEAVRPDGGRIQVSVTVRCRRDSSGRVLFYDNFCIDISERKEAEKRLRESEETSRAILDASPDIAFLMDTDERMLAANEAVAEAVEKPLEELVGANALDLLPADVAESRRAYVQKAIRSGRPVEFEDSRRGRRFQHCISPIFDPSGSVARLAVFTRDVTEQKRAEEALRQSEREKAAILNSVGVLVAYHDRQLRIIWTNRAAAESVHQKTEDLIGRHCYRIWQRRESPCPDCPVTETFSTGEPCELETTTPHGRDFRIRSYPVKDEHGELTGVVEVGEDVTEQRRAEQALRASLQEKEILLKEIHHRVKNNMQIVSSLLNLQAAAIEDPRLRAVFEESRSRVRAMALVHETLYQSGNLARVNLAAYVPKLAKSILSLYGRRNEHTSLDVRMEEMELHIDQIVPCSLVFHELIANSCKHAFPEETRGRIFVRGRRLADHRVEFVIGDDGAGLPREVEVHAAPTLGLGLVAGLVEQQLGGTLELSRENGTRFTIRFAGPLPPSAERPPSETGQGESS